MSKYYLVHHAERCVDCLACEVQCKTHHGLPPGPNLCQVLRVGPEGVSDPTRLGFVFMPCFHCDEAACLAVCPTGAVRRREDHGIVHIASALCIGCKSCVTACAWGACQFDPVARKAVKCDYCMDRLDAGLQPSCATVCLTSCIDFVPADQIPDRFSKVIDAVAGHPEVIR
jgi:Fe-S-cluster-containing dehydrogenase component